MKTIIQDRPIATQLVCHHCGEPCLEQVVNESQQVFCCSGCMHVHRILNENGLTQYYSLRENAREKGRKVELKKRNFDYLDNAEFLAEHASRDRQGMLSMDFYLEGIHCLACLWLIEKLPEISIGVLSSRLQMGKNTVTIKIDPTLGKFSKAIRDLENLGYSAHVLTGQNEIEKLKTRERHKDLIRIAIASAATMNIMLYSVSTYAGAMGIYAKIFSWINFILAIPVVFYSSTPFYKSALASLKRKEINLDVPLAVAIIIGFSAGVVNTLRGSHENYFDSISMLVFFILSTRYLLKIAQTSALENISLASFIASGEILRKRGDSFESIHSSQIQKGDILKVQAGDTIPTDGTLLSESCHVDESALTGESLSVSKFVGDLVSGGTRNIDREILLTVNSTPELSRLGKILKDLEQNFGEKTQALRLSEKFSKYIVGIALGLSALTSVTSYFLLGFDAALSRSVAIIIITCPCAFALAAPLTFTRSIALAMKKGILIKDERTLDYLKDIKNIFFDKTGTLTQSQYKVSSFEVFNPEHTEEVIDSVYAIESKSKHPLAMVIKDFLKGDIQTELEIADFIEIPTVGVEAKIGNHTWTIASVDKSIPGHFIAISKDREMVAQFTLEDQLRPGVAELISKLKQEGKNIFILSGDREKNVKDAATALGIDEKNIMWKLTPKRKQEIIESFDHTMMVGDGANDALAMKASDVGLATQGSVGLAMKASHIYLSASKISELDSLFKLTQMNFRILNRNLIFSLSYNIAGASLAVMGYIDPLWAAIIMPISSLTVLSSTMMGTRKSGGRSWK